MKPPTISLLKHDAEIAALKVAHEKELQAAEKRNLTLLERNEILESTNIEVKISLMNKDEQLREQVANAQELEDQRTHELEQRQQPESSSVNAQRAKEYLLSKALAIAHHESLRNYNRMRELSEALEATPNQVANIKGLLEEKDLELFKLEKRALLCQAELIRTERDARFFRTVSMDELLNYHKRLHNAMGTIKVLEESRSGYQQECAHLLKIIRNKVTRLRYMESPEHFQQLLLNDKQLLASRLKEKDIEIAYAEDRAGLLERDLRDLRFKLEIKEQEMSELKDTLACKIGDNLLLETKVSNLVHSSEAKFEHYDSLLEMKQQEIMKLFDSIRQLNDQTPGDLITDDRHLGLEEVTGKVELLLLPTADNNKDEKIEELERSVDELRIENNEYLDELVGLREVNASNAEEAVYARYNLDMALTELRGVLVGMNDDPERFYKFKQQGLLKTLTDEETETETESQQHKIQSLQEKLDEAQEDAKAKHTIYEIKLEKLQRYAGVIRNLGFDLISRLQGDDDETETSSLELEKWGFEDMFDVLNSQAHLLNDKGKSRAGSGTGTLKHHESGVEEKEYLIMNHRYEDERIIQYSYHRNGQGQDNINEQSSGQGGTYSDEEVNKAVNVPPGRQSKLDDDDDDDDDDDGGHYKDGVGTLAFPSSGEGEGERADEHEHEHEHEHKHEHGGGDTTLTFSFSFSGGGRGHNNNYYDRDRPLFSTTDHLYNKYTFENCAGRPLFSVGKGKFCCLPDDLKKDNKPNRGISDSDIDDDDWSRTPQWPPYAYGSVGFLRQKKIIV